MDGEAGERSESPGGDGAGAEREKAEAVEWPPDALAVALHFLGTFSGLLQLPTGLTAAALEAALCAPGEATEDCVETVQALLAGMHPRNTYEPGAWAEVLAEKCRQSWWRLGLPADPLGGAPKGGGAAAWATASPGARAAALAALCELRLESSSRART